MTDTKDDSHRFSASSHLEHMPADDRGPSVGDLKPVIEDDDANNPKVREYPQWYKHKSMYTH